MTTYQKTVIFRITAKNLLVLQKISRFWSYYYFSNIPEEKSSKKLSERNIHGK